MDEDGAVLADAVGAVGGLVFDRGVPPGVEKEDVVGGCQVQAGSDDEQLDSSSMGPRPALRATRPCDGAKRCQGRSFWIGFAG